MPSPFASFQGTLGFLTTTGLSLWFPVWAWRRRGELDRPFTKPMMRLRAVVVTFGLVFASFPLAGRSLRGLQGASALLGIAFWVWPNLAYYTVVFLRRRDLLYVTRKLRGWNPLGFEGDPDDAKGQLTIYDEYAPRILAALDETEPIGAVQAELTAIRSVWNVDPDILGDRQVAEQLVTWRKLGAQNVAA